MNVDIDISGVILHTERLILRPWQQEDLNDFYAQEKFPDFANKRCREIGYVLSKEYWGQGLIPEVVKEVIRYLFEDIELDVISGNQLPMRGFWLRTLYKSSI